MPSAQKEWSAADDGPFYAARGAEESAQTPPIPVDLAAIEGISPGHVFACTRSSVHKLRPDWGAKYRLFGWHVLARKRSLWGGGFRHEP